MAATDISSQQQQFNDFVVEPKLTESVINLDNILQECNDQVMIIGGLSTFPARIHKILKHNQMLMSSYLKVFQNKFGLKKLLKSISKKLSLAKTISLKLAKKVSLALVNYNLIPKDWLRKPIMEIPVNFSNQGPMISVLINNKLATCILDSGSTFTLIPFKLFQQMNIRPNNLNSSVIYNINSASHHNLNAVL